MIADQEVDIVYVGNVHRFRRVIGEKVLKGNKHCLLEKPFSCNLEDSRRNLFCLGIGEIPDDITAEEAESDTFSHW